MSQRIARYEVLEELGRGAMGVVFKARDPRIGRFVAIKTITAGIADDQDLLQRFQREAQAAGGLQHPNIVTIYEMSESGGAPFIAMEYLEGESLEKILGERVQMPLAQKLGYMVQVSRALDYAHRREVIHRDIKPANIVLTSEGVVKVVDFGIARIADTTKTKTGVLLGTISYMSPEQVSGKRADERSDIWSLGVVFYELLTYHRPFNGDNHAAVLMSILRDEPPPVSEFVPNCPVALEKLVARALRKDESARYPTMEALLAELEPIWTSLQQQAVHRLVVEGHELIAAGKLEEASEVLRQSLSIDTGSLTAKALLDQVNALLQTGSAAAQEPQRPARKPDQVPDVSAAGQGRKVQERSGTLVATVPFPPAGLREAPAATPPSERLRATVPSVPRQPSAAARPAVPATVPATTLPVTLPANRPARPQPANPGVPGARIGGNAPSNAAPLPTQPLSVARQEPVKAQRDPIVDRRKPIGDGQPAKPTKVSSPKPPVPLLLTAPQKRGGPSFAVVGVIALMAIGAFGYWKMFPRTEVHAPATDAQLPANPAVSMNSTPSASVTPAAAATDALPAAPNAVPASGSLEDQQRHLIDLAHEAADVKDYKTAQLHLDEAAKLNGPLNPIIGDLRRSFSEEAHGAELRKVAQQEESLWANGMAAVDAGRFDDAEKLMRAILVLPEGGRRWSDAARYVDEAIPQRRQDERLWASAQQAAQVKGPDSRINEVKLLDQILVRGGPHQQEARDRRDSLILQFGRNNRRRNNLVAERESASEPADFPQLQDSFDQAVSKADAGALEQLQGLRPKFMSIAEGGGPFAAGARDYINNLVPSAQKVIEEKLAKTEADTAANAEYQQAVSHFNQAVATQNSKALRAQVPAEFQQIASAGGPRAEEARQYVSALIPAALNKTGN